MSLGIAVATQGNGCERGGTVFIRVHGYGGGWVGVGLELTLMKGEGTAGAGGAMMDENAGLAGERGACETDGSQGASQDM